MLKINYNHKFNLHKSNKKVETKNDYNFEDS